MSEWCTQSWAAPQLARKRERPATESITQSDRYKRKVEVSDCVTSCAVSRGVHAAGNPIELGSLFIAGVQRHCKAKAEHEARQLVPHRCRASCGALALQWR